MSKKPVFYRAPERCGPCCYRLHGIPVGCSIQDPDSYQALAEVCAEEYYVHFAGWDGPWPVLLTLHGSSTSREVAQFTVNFTVDDDDPERLAVFAATPWDEDEDGEGGE